MDRLITLWSIRTGTILYANGKQFYFDQNLIYCITVGSIKIYIMNHGLGMITQTNVKYMYIYKVYIKMGILSYP